MSPQSRGPDKKVGHYTKDSAISPRNLLVASSALAAVPAVPATAPTRIAQAQPAPASAATGG